MQSPDTVVLVVEDNHQMAALLQDLLEEGGYTVKRAATGAAGLAQIEAGAIDLVLLDRRLPDLDGLEVCRRVRARTGELYLPIIVLTALSDEADRHAGFAAGANDYVSKPFGADDLLDRVHVWANTRQRIKAYHGELAEAYGRLTTVDRQREEFLTLVSHELRQPVATIAALAEGLARAPQRDEAEQQALASLRHQAHALGRLAEDLLAIARLEAGSPRLRPTTFDLVALVAALARETSEPERVHLAVPAQPVLIEADPERVRQAVENLLTNALKYSPPDRPVDLAVTATETEARVAVTDRGIGLAPDELPRLFQKYGRLRGGRSAGIGGVGLGLYLTRLLVESHGGQVTAASPGPGHGATFTLVLPHQAAVPAADAATTAGSPRPAPEET